MRTKKKLKKAMRFFRKEFDIEFIEACKAAQSLKKNGWFFSQELFAQLGGKIVPGCSCCGNWIVILNNKQVRSDDFPWI